MDTELNKIFLDVVDDMEALDKNEIFHMPVTNQVAPNYKDKISRPVSLMDMKLKGKRRDYKSKEGFMEDVRQMR